MLLGVAMVECSSSAFRKLGTPHSPRQPHKAAFSRRRFCLRVLSIKEKREKEKKKHSWTARSRRVFYGLLETPSKSLNFEIQCVRRVARKVRDLLASSIFFLPLFSSFLFLFFFFFYFARHRCQFFRILFEISWLFVEQPRISIGLYFVIAILFGYIFPFSASYNSFLVFGYVNLIQI